MKTKQSSLTAVGVSVLMLAALPSVADPSTANAKPNETYTGMVATVNPNSHTLDVKGLVFSKTFNVGDHCAYALWEKPAGAFGDLLPGEKVTVTYQDASGVLVAGEIKQLPMTEQGMVKTIDPAAHTLTLQSGWKDRTYQLADNCAVKLSGDQSGTLQQLQPGTSVIVTYELPQHRAIVREIAQTGAEFTGKLTAVDMSDHTLKARSVFDTRQFHMANNCAIVIDGKTGGQLSDLKLGQPVRFSYNDVNGIDVVTSIANEPATQASESTSHPSDYNYTMTPPYQP
jgi:hypothetical protein